MGNFNIYYKAIMIPAILIAFTFHEFAHAFIADRLGDNTPRYEGRLTLNPVKHIDLAGFLMIMIFGFGWAKPVRTNPYAYKNYYRDDLFVSIAGPIANFLTSILFSIIFGLYIRYVYINIPNNVGIKILSDIIEQVITLNVFLGFFNLLPIPGFDGFHVLKDLFKGKLQSLEEKLWPFRMLLLFVAVYFARLIIAAPAVKVIGWLYKIINFIALSIF